MNKKAILYMFADAFGVRLRTGLHRRVDNQFSDIADALHSPNISVYYPKGSKAKQPVCAIVLPVSVFLTDKAHAFVYRRYVNVSGHNVYIVEAGYVNVADASERARLRTKD